MNSYNIEDLKADELFSEDVFLDDAFLLIPAHCRLSGDQIEDLKEWGFRQIHSEGKVRLTTTPPLSDEGQNDGTKSKLTDISAETDDVDISDFLGSDSSVSVSKPAVKKLPEQAPPAPQKQAEAAAEPSKPQEQAAAPRYDAESFEKVKKVYADYTKFINDTYTYYATNKTFNNQEISEQVAKLCTFIRENRSNMLRIISTQEITDKNFLIDHCMRSTVVSLTIGMQLKMSEEKLVELGTACLLHEIGMIFLPPQLYMSDRQLSAPEKLMMNTHPIVSYNILKKANFSLNVQLAVLEHHERINGSGYPRHVSGDKISLYAKIIAVACSFEAITAPRKYKEERSTFEALVEMLRNSNRQYDGTIMKTLLYSISLYPIGVYVYLSNGKIAQVVDVTPGSPRTPFVQVLGEEGAQPVQVDMTKLKIIRVLNKKEVSDTLSSLQKMNTDAAD